MSDQISDSVELTANDNDNVEPSASDSVELPADDNEDVKPSASDSVEPLAAKRANVEEGNPSQPAKKKHKSGRDMSADDYVRLE